MTDGKQHSILLVEDEESLLMLLGSALEKEGYTVLKATDGEQGARIALAEHPDLIIADLKMPKMGGMDMIGAIRKDTWGKSVKVIILTNAVGTDTIADAIGNEAFFYIVKGDWTLESIVKKIKSHLDTPPAKA